MQTMKPIVKLLVILIGCLLNPQSNCAEKNILLCAREALYAKNNTKLEKLLTVHPELLNMRYKDGHTLLTWAIYLGYEKNVITLLNHGANIHLRTTPENYNLRPIDWAALRSDHKIYQILKERGAKDDIITLVLKATLQDVINFRLREEIQKDYCWGNDLTPINAAIITGKLEILKFLLDSGFQSNIHQTKVPASHCAILYSLPEALDMILQHESSQACILSDIEKKKLFGLLRFAKKEKRKELESILTRYYPIFLKDTKEKQSNSKSLLTPIKLKQK